MLKRIAILPVLACLITASGVAETLPFEVSADLANTARFDPMADPAGLHVAFGPMMDPAGPALYGPMMDPFGGDTGFGPMADPFGGGGSIAPMRNSLGEEVRLSGGSIG